MALSGHMPGGRLGAATLLADTNDCEVQVTLSSPPLAIADLTSSGLIIGTAGTAGKERCPVIPFQLPDFGATTNPFLTANFSCNFSGYVNTPLGSADLYGLGRRAAPTVLTNDYWSATNAMDPADATLLQTNFLVAGMATGLVAGSAAGNAALVNYLNTQYANGAGAGQYVFLRLSTDTAQTGVARWQITSAEGAAASSNNWPQITYNAPDPDARPFIWVRQSERAGILAKIATSAWATSLSNSLASREAADFASYLANRDSYLRQLPVNWSASPATFQTQTSGGGGPAQQAETMFNNALDCAILYYLSGNTNYAQCAADMLHNTVTTLFRVAPSTSTGNGGWIIQNDLLYEARQAGTQLPMIYDFVYPYLQTRQVYDVQTGGMVNFNFANAQSVFRTYYELVRDHGQKDDNWSALMATCMLNNLLALDSATERASDLQVYLATGSSRQASLDYDYRNYSKPGDIWPESLQYSSAVGSIRTFHMVLLERYNPALNLFGVYSNLPTSLPRISQLRYPNTSMQIMFGDGHRDAGGQPYSDYELVYQHALARGYSNFTSLFGSLLKAGISAGEHNRSTLSDYSKLGPHNEPLQLLWDAPSIAEAGVALQFPRTDTLPWAGLALQRNPSTANNSIYGLMCFVQGAGHVHSHASGMNMELFGMGQVLGSKSGVGSYGSAIHENYYRLFAGANTVIVNGVSQGSGGWSGISIPTVQTLAMEPQPFAAAVSSNFSFTCSSFSDSNGSLSEAAEQRTLAIVRTSLTNGFYVDIFRSSSAVNNQVATTLNGSVTNQFHDYIYRNLGSTNFSVTTNGVSLPLFSQPNRFQTDIGDAYQQPGWRYFTNTVVSYPHNAPTRVQFDANPSGTHLYMDMIIPAVTNREYARVASPPFTDGPNTTSPGATIVIRQIGEAWSKPFAAVYEPHFSANGATVTNVTALWRTNVVVGMKIQSVVGGRGLVHYVLSNTNTTDTYQDPSLGFSFTGRFGIVSDDGAGHMALYLGQGKSLSYRGNSVAVVGATNSQAEVQFNPGQPPIVTANAPVNIVSASAPVFRLITRQADATISLLATGSNGVPYRLWSTTNLADGTWTTLTSGTITNSPFVIHDFGAASNFTHFYRFSTP